MDKVHLCLIDFPGQWTGVFSHLGIAWLGKCRSRGSLSQVEFFVGDPHPYSCLSGIPPTFSGEIQEKLRALHDVNSFLEHMYIYIYSQSIYMHINVGKGNWCAIVNISYINCKPL